MASFECEKMSLSVFGVEGVMISKNTFFVGPSEILLGHACKTEGFDALVYNCARPNGISLGCTPWCMGK